MAIYTYICTCGRVIRRILDAERLTVTCPNCLRAATRKPQGASVSVYETIDNGVQARATVRPADAERIFKEREIENDLKQEAQPDEDDMEKIDDQGQLL
jgi:hypothetical protein